MIFVALGTQKFQFNRLVEMIDRLSEEKEISEDIFIQTGHSDYVPKHCAYQAFLTKEEFEKKITEADIVIAHAGVGTIMDCLSKDKKLIVVPRDSKYKEHVDCHQYEIAECFAGRGHILKAENYNELKHAINNIDEFTITKYVKTKSEVENIIDRYIVGPEKMKVLMVGSNLSVKGGIVSVLKNYLSFDKWEKSDIIFVPTHIEGSAKVKIMCFLNALKKIRKILKSQNVQIVHIHVSERGSFIRKSIVLRMAKKRGCKVILHHHGAEFEQYYDGAKPKLKKYISDILEEADLNIVLSGQIEPVIRRISAKVKIEVLYNAVHVERDNKYNTEAREFTMLGRLEERKGTFKLLDTIKKIDFELPEDVKFNLCGDGNLEKVKETIEKLEIGHRIRHLGWTNGKEKQEILDRTMAHVLFSYNEGLPMAILETMAHGIVNVSTNIAAIPEVIIDGETGFLVEPGDTKTLGKVLLDISSNDELRKEISKNSHELILKRFSIENSIKKVEEIYQQL